MNIEKINGWFSLRGEWILKRRWLILVSFALLFAVGLSGLKYLNISSSWEDYFLEDDPMLVKTEEFKEIFGNDNYAAVFIISKTKSARIQNEMRFEAEKRNVGNYLHAHII